MYSVQPSLEGDNTSCFSKRTSVSTNRSGSIDIGEETQRNQINETRTIKDKVGIANNASKKLMGQI